MCVDKREYRKVGRSEGGLCRVDSISADAFLRVAFVCLLCSIPAKMVNCLVVRARAIVKVSQEATAVLKLRPQFQRHLARSRDKRKRGKASTIFCPQAAPAC